MSTVGQLSGETKRDKAKFVMTKTSYLSIELNAHCFLHSVVLVKEGKLPKESLNTFLFNSQTCEAMFRSARSLSGIHSTRVNFTVDDFLSDETLCFLMHHMHFNHDAMLSLENVNNAYSIDLRLVIEHAYMAAVELINDVGIAHSLIKHGLQGLERCNDHVYEHFHRTKRIFDDSGILFEDEPSDFDDLTSDEDEDDPHGGFDASDRDAELISSQRTNYPGVRLVNEISQPSQCSYFEIKMNGQVKYLHKQSAVWL